MYSEIISDSILPRLNSCGYLDYLSIDSPLLTLDGVVVPFKVGVNLGDSWIHSSFFSRDGLCTASSGVQVAPFPRSGDPSDSHSCPDYLT